MVHETPTVFVDQGCALAGAFFRDGDLGPTRQPALVVTGSWLNVKEQMAGLYARRLATQGFTTFVLDFANFGESDGPVRQAEIPTLKVSNLAAAARFLASQSFVDPERIGFLGVCASAQYGLRAIAEGAGFRSYAAVAGWFHDAASVAPFYGNADGVGMRLRRGADALQRWRRDRTVVMVPAYEAGNDRAGMHFELDYYGNASRGAVPSWKNEMAELTWQHWLMYDGLSPAAGVQTPALFVHSDGCALPDNAKLVHGRVRGRKELVWLDGTQQDYYDQPRQVDQATEHVVSWFRETLR
jgi:fermentation-respiration switch protein FrsA (DUF1100 family)